MAPPQTVAHNSSNSQSQQQQPNRGNGSRLWWLLRYLFWYFFYNSYVGHLYLTICSALRIIRLVRAGQMRLSQLWARLGYCLPCMFTFGSVLCGFKSLCIIIKSCSSPSNSAAGGSGISDVHYAAKLLLLSMVFDILDGKVARLTNTASQFGLHLDSLADSLSFAIAPSLLLFHAAKLYLLPLGVGTLACFLYAACGIARLARYNVLSTNQIAGRAGAQVPRVPGRYVRGLPTPGAASILIALLLLINDGTSGYHGNRLHLIFNFVITSRWLLSACLIFLSTMMMSSIEFYSLKDWKPSDLRRSKLKLLLLVVAMVIWLWMGLATMILSTMIIYIGVPLFESARDFVTSLMMTSSAAASDDVDAAMPEPPPSYNSIYSDEYSGADAVYSEGNASGGGVMRSSRSSARRR